jgi:phosphopantetheine adenylyltransferase
LIAPTEERIKDVFDFLEDIKPSIEHRVVPINDIYGPTITDPEIQFIVLSEETKKGGGLINEERTKKVKE